MSAITGIFHRDGKPVHRETIQKMNETLAHRGPDGSSIWGEGPVAFGHQMLHTTSESLQEVLPFEDDASGLVITADARIDNRQELSEQLGLEDTEEVADSQYILKAYEKWGENCPEKLLGDFAFAIWDGEKLFCARDHMGVKPFYYYLSPDFFIFSTEIKALLSFEGFKYKVNEKKVADYLLNILEERNSTFYKNIKRLPAASYLAVNQSGFKCEVYWELEPLKEIHFENEEEYHTTYQEIFFEAVRCRLRSQKSVGCELSGGFDSSSIACTAKKHLLNSEDTIETFSIIYDLPDCDESPYIKRVVEDCELRPNYLVGNRVDPFVEQDRYSEICDQPLYAHSMHSFWCLYQIAAKKNLRVVLSGFEGDETLGRDAEFLYPYYLFKNGKFNLLINEVRRIARNSNQSAYQVFFSYLGGALAPNILKKLWRYIGQGSYHHTYQKIMEDVIKEDFVNRSGFETRKEFFNDYLDKKASSKSPRQKHFYDLSSTYYQQFFEEVDPIAAANSIEIRYPYMDIRLLEFCLALPPEILFQGTDRRIARLAMESILPKDIQWRQTKGTIDTNINLSLMEYGTERLGAMIMDNSTVGDYVDLDRFHEVFDDFKSKNKIGYIGESPRAIWRVYCLYKWLI